jgi:uncharacterized Ntn-hydrolase superfamily protein
VPNRLSIAVVATLSSLALAACAHPRVPAIVAEAEPETPGTFSIIAYDSANATWGGAVASKVYSVGNGVLWAEPNVGVVATQASVDVSYGPQALALLRQGKSAADALKEVMDKDPDLGGFRKSGRQFAVIDAKGNVAAHTGPSAQAWAGDRQGKFVTAQGNILAGKQVVDSMLAAFERTPGALQFKLIAALEAGDAAGGDSRGKQSAAMLVVKKCGGVWLHNDIVLRLQVDDSPAPIPEMRRLVQLNRGRPNNPANDPACK